MTQRYRPMTQKRRDERRDIAGIGIVLFMSVLALCTFAGSLPWLGRRTPDADRIVMDEDRFARMRTALPARGTIGYLSDIGGGTDNNAEYARAYFLTQYYLAPVVVAPDSAYEIVVANFVSQSDLAQAADARGFSIEREFSTRVALLRRRR